MDMETNAINNWIIFFALKKAKVAVEEEQQWSR